METVPLNLNGFSILTNSFIEKIQLLDSPSLQIEEKEKVLDDYLNFAQQLREFCLTNAISENHRQTVRSIFGKYEEEIYVLAQCEESIQKYSSYGKTLISSLLKFLGKRGSGILIIGTYIHICLKILANSFDEKTTKNDILNTQLLMQGIMSYVNLLQKYWFGLFVESQRNAIMLCLNQVCKCLPILLKTMGVENCRTKGYITERLTQCFQQMSSNIHNATVSHSDTIGSEFINLMDSALYYLTLLAHDYMNYSNIKNMAVDTLASLKAVIDELLCHAMSIAQVTTSDLDYKAISANSQKVLAEFKQLTQGVTDDNRQIMKLNAESVTDAVCQLERRVNSAVLRLVLEVFTNLNSPLKELVVKCREDYALEGKVAQDLTPLISKFDTEMDRIMQIGLFSISCTSDMRRVLEIKSCLASMESLEAELIPTITAVYVDGSAISKYNFQFLIEHWLKEMASLKTSIDLIIDPAAFCEVVECEVSNLVLSLKKNESASYDVAEVKRIAEQVVRYSKKLMKTLNTGVEDEGDDVEGFEETKARLLHLHMAVQECEASLTLLVDEDVNIVIKRVVKRCDLVLNNVRALRNLLSTVLSVNETNMDQSEEESDLKLMKPPQKSFYKLCTPTCDSTVMPEPDMTVLTPFLQQGKLIARERRVFYTTPKAEPVRTFNKSLLRSGVGDRTPLARSKCCKPVPRRLELSNSLDLEVTTILENLSRLSTTFNCTVDVPKVESEEFVESSRDVGSCEEQAVQAEPSEQENVNVSDDEGTQLGFMSKMKNRLLESLDSLSRHSSLFASKDSHEQYSTPDRIQDLIDVDNKIDFLKNQIPEFGLP